MRAHLLPLLANQDCREKTDRKRLQKQQPRQHLPTNRPRPPANLHPRVLSPSGNSPYRPSPATLMGSRGGATGLDANALAICRPWNLPFSMKISLVREPATITPAR